MGGDIVISFETLYDLLRREKGKDELQQLEDSYFTDVTAYLQEKLELLNTKTDTSDLFTQGEREKIETEIKNIKKIIIELYERREKKIVEMAINKSRTSSNIIETETMLPQERQLFDTIVSTLNVTRQHILAPLLRASPPAVIKELPTELEPTPAMPSVPEPEVAPEEPMPAPPAEVSEPDASSDPTSTPIEPTSPSVEAPESELATTPSTQEPVTIMITHPIPQFLGEELETYGPYQPGDLATLPRMIADLIVEKGRGEIKIIEN